MNEWVKEWNKKQIKEKWMDKQINRYICRSKHGINEIINHNVKEH